MAKKILIVEDERPLAKMLSNKLKRYGFKVNCAYNSMDAIKKIKLSKPDLVLLDIVMPGRSGFFVLEEIRKFKSLQKLIVIIVSNLDQAKDIEKAKQLGADDYIVKSNLSIQDVVNKVNLFLNN